MGDLNEILYQLEKEGGNPWPPHFVQNFRDAIEDCRLSDCGYIREKFTWHRGGIRERLDCGLANDAWSNRFGDAVLQNLDYEQSDHRPILMCLEAESQQEVRGPSVLRFEAKWLKESQFQHVVENAWEQSSMHAGSGGLAGKLAVVHSLLHKWDWTVLQNSSRKLRMEKKDFEKVAAGPLSEESVIRQKELAQEIEFLLEQEEIPGHKEVD